MNFSKPPLVPLQPKAVNGFREHHTMFFLALASLISTSKLYTGLGQCEYARIAVQSWELLPYWKKRRERLSFSFLHNKHTVTGDLPLKKAVHCKQPFINQVPQVEEVAPLNTQHINLSTFLNQTIAAYYISADSSTVSNSAASNIFMLDIVSLKPSYPEPVLLSSKSP